MATELEQTDDEGGDLILTPMEEKFCRCYGNPESEVMGQLRAPGACFGEEEQEGVGVRVLGELVEGGLEGSGRVGGAFAERV